MLLLLWSVDVIHEHMQASIWDVDGTGMQQIPDAELDLKLRKVGLGLSRLARCYIIRQQDCTFESCMLQHPSLAC